MSVYVITDKDSWGLLRHLERFGPPKLFLKAERLAGNVWMIAAVTEEKPEERPKCGWPVQEKQPDGTTTEKRCNREDGILYKAKGYNIPICEKHREQVWKIDGVDEIDPL